MSVNARGWVVLTSSLVVLGLTSAVLFWPSHNKSSPAPLPTATVSSSTPRAVCNDLATRYESAWESPSRCSSDDECVAEPRGGIYTVLDGCARFYNRGVSHKEADLVAAEWLRSTCASAQTVYVDCGPARAQCLAGHCAELPPPPIPKDWGRLSLLAVVSVFAPSDLLETDARGIDSFARTFVGKNRRLTLTVDAYLSRSDAGAPTVLDGHAAHVVKTALGTREQTRITFDEPWVLWLPGSATVMIEIGCDDRVACADVPAIVRSVHFMTKSFPVSPY
jgi:hypothetical protein